MGRVCEKHNEFYETECRWCEPTSATYSANGNVGWYSHWDLLPVGCNHERRSVNQDACADCGMTGTQIAQMAHARMPPTPVE